jgi:phosphoglycolate phosphatase
MAEVAVIKGIMFDKDGVLVDFDQTWIKVLVDMANELAGGDVARENELLVRAGYDRATGRFFSGSVWAAGNNDELIEVWDDVGTAQSNARLAEYVDACCLAVEPVPLLLPQVLQNLFRDFHAAGTQLAIATNDMEASAIQTMEKFGLSGFLTAIFGYDSVVHPKPAADPVIAFCRASGLEARHVAMVGDNVHDMEMARAGKAGLAIGVLSGNSTADELAPHADYLIQDIRELPALLASI